MFYNSIVFTIPDACPVDGLFLVGASSYVQCTNSKRFYILFYNIIFCPLPETEYSRNLFPRETNKHYEIKKYVNMYIVNLKWTFAL